MPEIVVRDATLEDLMGFHACVGAVAVERKYIGLIEAPPLESSERWLRALLDARHPVLVATDGDLVVGWCDVGGREPEGFRHGGGLGMGLLPEARGIGVGARLLALAIERSREAGLERIELQVYASNVRARRLYEKFGFRVEGVRVRARKLDGVYDDVVMMALFLRPGDP